MMRGFIINSKSKDKTVAIVGGGPAGLFCAEQIAAERQNDALQVIVLEAMPYAGRKFLVAGKNGLNLTSSMEESRFISQYSGNDCESRWQSLFAEFNHSALRQWAQGLGFETFESSGHKVFPKPMKAGALLRAWIDRLEQMGVQFLYSNRVVGIDKNGEQWCLQCCGQQDLVFADAVVFALGGASWSQTGSDGAWVAWLQRQLGISTVDFAPANCGWEVDWPELVAENFAGQPIKNVRVSIPGLEEPGFLGELTITKYGIEGGPIYHLGPVLRSLYQEQGIEIYLDFKPDIELAALNQRMSRVRKNYIREAKRRCNLSDSVANLLKRLPYLGPWKSGEQIASAIKHCPLHLQRPRPIEEAISSAGGIAWQELNHYLMLDKAPGIFVAGEMIDWEAPTGGFLLQGCFSTAFRAAAGVTRWID